MVGISLAKDRVLPHLIEGLDLSLVYGIEYFYVGQPVLAAKRGVPSLLEFFLCLRVRDLLVPRVNIGQGS